LFVRVSDFVLIGKDALQSEIWSSVTIPLLVRVLCADLWRKTRVWIRRFRRDQSSDTDQTELESSSVERAQY